MAKTFEEYLKEQNKLSADQLAKDKATYNSGFDTQIKNVTDNHNLLVKEMEEKYDLEQQANEVQKILNERQIAESNANMGTTDSGLNRTQMTAAQLSYANNKSRINQIKLKGLESLKLSLSQAVTGIEQDRRNTIAVLESDYAANDRSNAVSLFNQQQQKAADIEAARIKAQTDALKAKQSARSELIKLLSNDEISDSAKRAYYEDYENTYGIDESDSVLDSLTSFDLSGRYVTPTEDTEAMSLFKASLPSGREWSRFSKSKTEYIDEALKRWYEEEKIDDTELAALMEFYGID